MLMQAIEHYLEVRRSLGDRLEATGTLLKAFGRFAVEHGDTHIVANTAVAWAKQSTTQRQRCRRLSMVTAMARFLRAEDTRHELPPEAIFHGRQRRPTPYIFTTAELQALLTQAKKLGPRRSLRPQTYYTLFGLMATAGLRVSEALSLRLDDFTGDAVLIRDSKFHKDRLLPLHQSAAAVVERYVTRRRILRETDDHLFVSLRRTRLHYDTVWRTFRHLCSAAAIPHRPHPRSVRLYDLRHTYAVRALEGGPRDREQVTPHMLAVTNYMGHASVRSTYWYFESTPQLLGDIATACESFVNGELS
jgi:site-specific recombinase XerD